MEKKDSATRAIICPYCPSKSRRSRLFALHKCFKTPKGFKFRCRVCGKSFIVRNNGKYIIKEEMLEVIDHANEETDLFE